jgi:hypothetical protein
MWPSKMHVEQLIAQARTLRGLVAQTGRRLNSNPKAVWKSSASELAANDSLDYRMGAVPFQQRLQVAEMQGMTLREFEKHLA